MSSLGLRDGTRGAAVLLCLQEGVGEEGCPLYVAVWRTVSRWCLSFFERMAPQICCFVTYMHPVGKVA